jgi:AcrR family transcriptional regulator
MSRDPSKRQPVEGQEAREAILLAALAAIDASGVERVTVPDLCRAAEVEERVFSELFTDLTDCLLSVFDELAERVLIRARQACVGERRWVDGVREALTTLLELADAHPRLAHFMISESEGASAVLAGRRRRLRAELAVALDDWHPGTPRALEPGVLDADALVSTVIAVLHGRLLEHPTPPLVELRASLMGMLVLPYLGTDGSRREIVRGEVLAQRPAPASCLV